MNRRRWCALGAAAALALVTVAPAADATASSKPPPGIITFAVKKPGYEFLAGVTTDGHTCNFASGGITSFAWSDDGTRLVFSRVDHEDPVTADLYFTKSFATPKNDRIPILTDHGTDGTFDRLPAWSPSRGAIVFTRASGPADARQSAIYWMHNNAVGIRAFTHPPIVNGIQTTDYWPTFSADGNFVAFVRERGEGVTDLGVVGAHGSERMLTTDGADARNGYGWSPNGQRIVFVRETGPATSDLWIVDASTCRERRLTSDAFRKYAPRWSPDGQHIVFEERKGNGIRAVEIDPNGRSRRVLAEPSGRALNPVWSTDSHYIAYYVFPPSGTPLENSLDERGRIELLDVATGRTKVLYRGKVNDVPLAWQPTPKLHGKADGFRAAACRGGIRLPPGATT